MSLMCKVVTPWTRTPEEGATTSVYLATEPGIEPLTGSHFADEQLVEPNAAALHDRTAGRLWVESTTATGCRPR